MMEYDTAVGDGDDDEMGSDYERAIALVGYGPFHWWLLLVSGIGNANEAIAIICVSILLPAAECELQLSTSDKGWLNVTMFLGMMIGGYAAGAVCDLFGRRKILMFCLVINGFFTIMMSLMQTKKSMLVMIFTAGIGVGGSVPVLWAYFTEFQPKEKRGTALCYLASFWMVGNIIVAGWLVIPESTIYTEPKRFQLSGWRLFVILCSIPSFLVTTALIYMPQSPKFLMMEGKNEDAVRVLGTIFHYNHPNVTIPNFHLNTTITAEQEYSKNFAYVSHLMTRNTSRLLHFPFRKVFCAIVLVVFSLCFGYYGLWMWLPEMFKRMEHNLADDVGLCDLATQQSQSQFQGESESPCAHSMDAEVFRDEIIVAVCNAPGHLIAILFMDKIGRRIFLMCGMIFSGLSVFAVWLVTSKFSCLLLSSLFGMLSALSHSALAVLGMEIFPTDLRGTAWGLSQISARLGAILGNVVFGELVDSRCSVPVLMVAVFLVMGGLFSQVMPDLTRMPLL